MSGYLSIPGELGRYSPALHDRTATREAKGHERARLALLEAIKDQNPGDIPADNESRKADPVDVLIEDTQSADLFIAVGYALNGDTDAAMRKLVQMANKAAAAFAFAHSSAYEDEAF